MPRSDAEKQKYVSLGKSCLRRDGSLIELQPFFSTLRMVFGFTQYSSSIPACYATGFKGGQRDLLPKRGKR